MTKSRAACRRLKLSPIPYRAILVTTLSAIVMCGSAAPLLAVQPTVTVEDAIAMVRVRQLDSNGASPVATFSPDSSKFATVLWHGDLKRNVNVYSIYVFDAKAILEHPGILPPPVLSADYKQDNYLHPEENFEDVRFLADNRTITFLGKLHGESLPQVYSINLISHQLHQLTHHPTAVRSYATCGTRVCLYSALAKDDKELARLNRLQNDGVSLADRSVFSNQRANQVATNMIGATDPRWIREYFFVPSSKAQPIRIFDSLQSQTTPSAAELSTKAAGRWDPSMDSFLGGHPSLAADPTDRYALLWPYALADHPMHPERYRTVDEAQKTLGPYYLRMYQPFGVVDLHRGRIERLLDVPLLPWTFNGDSPVWAPDGHSVIIDTLLPSGGDPGRNAAAMLQPQQWVEIEIGNRHVTPLGLRNGWHPIRWDAANNTVLLQQGNSFATISRGADGTWNSPSSLGTVTGLNPRYLVGTNGSVVIGVKDDLSVAPELAAYDLKTGVTTVLTDLNPELRRRRYGSVEEIHWEGPYDKASYGYLIKPVDYVVGKRYPLIVLLKDEGYRPGDHSFIMDGQEQLSGFAIQTLAAVGFVVLLTPSSPSIRDVVLTSAETEHERAHLESGIAYLDRLGLVDATRVAISGWSRAAYYANDMLVNSRFLFAAATIIDGGTVEYNEGNRPYTDTELQRIRTPLLIERHQGLRALNSSPRMVEALDALGKPVEVIWYPTGPHNLKMPQHRWRSLTTHVDWFRFWLQGYEDPDPAKRDQYARWHELRAMQERMTKIAQ